MKRLLPLLLFGLGFLPLSLSADIEPSKGDLLTVYIVNDIEGTGDLRILKEGQTEWKRAKEGETFEEGDRLKTGHGCEAVLTLKSNTVIHLDEDSELSATQLSENQTGGFLSRLTLWTGAILSDVKKHLAESQSSFDVESGGIVCGVRGTVFEVANFKGNISASTHEGEVQMSSSSGVKTIKAGQTCSMGHGKFSKVAPMGKTMRARFQGWRQIRQRMGSNPGGQGNRPSLGGGKLGMLGGRSGMAGPRGNGAPPPNRAPGRR